MKTNWLARQEALIGKEKSRSLLDKHVLVFGLGGVGGAATEALCRAGIGKLTLVDGDKFDETNLNRQIFATREMVGKSKTEAAKKRLISINPDLECETIEAFYLPDKKDEVFLQGL